MLDVYHCMHVCTLYCLFNCSSVNHLKPYADTITGTQLAL